jgi:hypothetical protein
VAEEWGRLVALVLAVPVVLRTAALATPCPGHVPAAQPSWLPRDCKANKFLWGAPQVRRVPGEALRGGRALAG